MSSGESIQSGQVPVPGELAREDQRRARRLRQGARRQGHRHHTRHTHHWARELYLLLFLYISFS